MTHLFQDMTTPALRPNERLIDGHRVYLQSVWREPDGRVQGNLGLYYTRPYKHTVERTMRMERVCFDGEEMTVSDAGIGHRDRKWMPDTTFYGFFQQYQAAIRAFMEWAIEGIPSGGQGERNV